MLLKKIILENIRSYTKQEIDFVEGSTLLTGNIGSGKTSILLAMDFALFGLRRGNLNGASLLRNGTNKGYVELYFEINNDKIVIKRTLKRGTTVTQDSGHVIFNGEKKELSPVELKQAILDLLNYPKDMLTRNKDLVYRYTVYTPQDEMKQILLASNDTRLETLRKVFGIDKYKTIKDNTKVFISLIKEKNRELQGYLLDLNSKQQELESLKEKNTKLSEGIIKLTPQLNSLNKDIRSKKQELSKIESDFKKLGGIRTQLELNEQKLNNNLERIKEDNEKIKVIEGEVEDINKNVNININIEQVERDLNKIKKNIEEQELELSSTKNEVSGARIITINSSKIIDEIQDLNVCPVCKQEVPKDYKDNVLNKEQDLVSNQKQKIDNLEKKELELNSNLNENKQEIEKLNNLEKEYEINKVKLDSISSKLTDVESLKSLQKRLNNEITEINVRNGVLYKELKEFGDIEEKTQEKNKEIENLQQELKSLEINKNILEIEKKNIDLNIENLTNEIERKELKRKDMEQLTKIQEWLEEYFIISLDTIENNIMLKVYNDFNSLFQKWFYTLVNTEDIKIRLNQDLSPLIEQNNHDIDYNYLSGGEKTAAALAYRLSLNQVINNLITSIKTNDLIILDEPTDGFSDEQLDRIRIVLKELNLKQIIIVSHEPKIETFVDNVISFKKENHITSIV
ncbi:MAG: AAA family ATPase [Candidatus Nanoarchaeia archaeon]|jgi:exonuclease SbcC|nr:AAA family ATPase [Candidatus Nanoarchaeia archaeon]|tara:strand:- start:35385 stop:37439 length:2055 start_codon:yes stop_codon:yes gene_type:complete